MIVMFFSRCRRSNISIISLRPCGSKPAVGSSKTKTSGSIAKTPAIATRRIWPPERSNGERSRKLSSKPTNWMYSWAKPLASSSEMPKFFGPKAISLATVSSNNWDSGNWKTIPTFLRNGFRFLLSDSGLMTRSPIVTVPVVGFNNAFKCCSNVDFPLPVWPTKAV